MEFGQFVGVAILLVGIVVWFVVVRRYESNRKDGGFICNPHCSSEARYIAAVPLS